MNVTKPISYELSRLAAHYGDGGLRDAYTELVSNPCYNEIVDKLYSPLYTPLNTRLFRLILINLEIYEK